MEAYNLLVNYKNYSANTNKRNAAQGGLDQVAFITEGKRLKTGKEFPHIKCFKCGEFRHYKSNCLEMKKKSEGEEMYHIIHATALMTQAKLLNEKCSLNPMWILCDNKSTVDIVENKNMVTNIRHTQNLINITGIGGTPVRINQIGDLLGYGMVYYHPDVARNII
jgi:hypothetical protein